MSLTLTEVPLASLAAARDAHFARLGEGPELYVELLLRTGRAHSLDWCGRSAGYCIASADGRLAELDLQRDAWRVGAALFAALADQLELRWARCFSFDSLLLGLCFELGWTPTIEGRLFRDLLDECGPAEPMQAQLRLRAATSGDTPLIVPYRDGVFDTDDECREWIDRGFVSVLEREGALLGIGLLSPVWPTRLERDVGVMVHPDHRGHGHAAHILRALKRRCLDQGTRPTAGCAVDNVASRRALNRAGFRSQFSLLKFERPGAGSASRTG